MVRNGISRLFSTKNGSERNFEGFSLPRNGSERNSDGFSLPRNGSERNSEVFLYRKTGGIPTELRSVPTCSEFCGIIFWSENGNPSWDKLQKSISSCLWHWEQPSTLQYCVNSSNSDNSGAVFICWTNHTHESVLSDVSRQPPLDGRNLLLCIELRPILPLPGLLLTRVLTSNYIAHC